MIDVKGKHALVTGGSRGIGLGIAKALAQGGARVAIAARKPDGLEAAKAELAKEGVAVETFVAHVGKADAIEKLVGDVVEKFGQLDVLVNNAATNPHFGPMMTADDSVFMKTMETNALGYFAMSRAVARHMVDKEIRGSIINVSSIQGVQASPLMGVYGVSKAGVVSLTKTMAVELGASGIRVNAIAPGLIETKFAAALTMNKDILDRFMERTPLGRIGQPEDIGGLALYLASDASSFLTGQCIVIDGGYTLG